MTTKSAAAASGLQTDYYHHEDKPMEQDVFVLACRISQCVCASYKYVCKCVPKTLHMNLTSAKDVMPVFLSPSVHVCICV